MLRTSIKKKISVLSGTRKTMQNWSKVIETFETLPAIYRPFFQTLWDENQEFPYIVLTPAVDSFASKSREKLICEFKNTIYTLEPADNQLSISAFPIKSIRNIEVGSILLYSWLTFNGRTQDGIQKSFTIEFNSISFVHFIPFINKVRSAPYQLDQISLEKEKNKFNYLNSSSFKFMNYGRKSLMGGEKVMQIVWEPEIREKIFASFSPFFFRTISTAHLSILTDKELILVREDEHSNLTKGARYGGIWQYIPHKSIQAVNLSESNNNLLRLTISLSQDEEIIIIFRSSNLRDADLLFHQISKIISS